MNLKKIFVLTLLTSLPVLTLAFKDVPLQNKHFKAIEYLTQKKVVNGYPDGTFQPNKKVIRAEAIKLILMATELEINANEKSYFKDVPKNQWFAPFVNVGVQEGIIKGDGTTGLFAPARQVNKAEFIKMLVESFQVDLKKYKTEQIVLHDAPKDAWFTPFMKFAVKFGVIAPDKQQNVFPGKFLTRGECAQIIFNLLKSGSGLDPQVLLNITENRLIKAIKALESNQLLVASRNASVGHEFAKTALKLLPKHKVIQAAEKTAYAVKNLIGSYAAGQNGMIDEVIKTSKIAWKAANESEQINPEQTKIAQEIKKLAESMAKKARAAKK
ncbi:hypothetical protein CSB37_03180 [bacterium DOLZORAL124_38_8]|nr:MAG: hypothetical protein CSB37_03180 [bacterium DOLZORAL124_38_8]